MDVYNINVRKELEKISSKLKGLIFVKKRFSELTKTYINLSKRMKKNQQNHFSGFCLLKVGDSLKKLKEELESAYFYLCAGRVYGKIDKEYFYFEEKVFCIELLNCFQEAIRLYDENKQWLKCSCLCYELGHSLMKMEKDLESSEYFIKSYQYSKKINHVNSQIDCLTSANECLIKTKDFDAIKKNLFLILDIYENHVVPFPKTNEIYLNLFCIYIIEKNFEKSTQMIENYKNYSSKQQIEYKIFLPLLVQLNKYCQLNNLKGILQIIKFEIKEFLPNEQHIYLKFVKKVYKKPIYFD